MNFQSIEQVWFEVTISILLLTQCLTIMGILATVVALHFTPVGWSLSKNAQVLVG